MLTRRARLAGLLAVSFYLVGLINDLQSIYFLTSFVISTCGVSFLLALYALTGLAVELEVESDQLFEGQPLNLRVRVANRATMRKGPLTLQLHLSNATQGITADRVFYLDSVAARETVEFLLPIDSLRRGEGRLEQVEAHCHDPLGLFRQRMKLTWTTRFTVYPQIWQRATREITGALGAQGATGQSGLAGRSLEFAAVRPYTDDDELRHVHWPSTARLGRLAVKQFQATARSATVIVLDLPPGTSAAGTGAHESAIRAATTVASEHAIAGKDVALLLLADEARTIGFGAGSWHRLRLLNALTRVRPPSRTRDELGQITVRFLAALPAHTQLIIITPSAPRAALHLTLRARRLHPLVITGGTDEAFRTALAPQSGRDARPTTQSQRKRAA